MIMDVKRGRRTGGWLAVLMVTTALGGVVLPGVAMAQAAAVQDQRHAFDISAQGLAEALPLFGRQAGIQVSAHGDVIGGARAAEVRGTMSVSEALSRLLAGTGITWRIAGSSAILERAAADGALLLDPVSVEGAAASGAAVESATGPVPGYVARRSATATKSDTGILETPQSISVVGAEEMQARNVYSIEDAIKYTPGVYLPRGTAGDTRDGFSAMRGFTSSFEYLDGMKLIGAWWSRTDFYNIERVEILRGPASVMYGQSVPGGLVNSVSKRPQEQAAGEVAMEYGTRDWTRGEADVTGPLDDKKQWLYRVTAAAQTSDGLNAIDHDQLNRNLLAPSLTWKPNGDSSLTMLLVRQEDEHQGYIKRMRYRTAAGESSPSTYLGRPDFDTFEIKQTAVTMLGEHAFSDRLKLNVNARWSEYDLHYRTAWPGNVEADGRTIKLSNYLYDDKGNTYQLDARLEGKLSLGPTEHTVTGGSDYSYQKVDFRRGGARNASSMDLFSPNYSGALTLPTQSASEDRSRMLGFYLQDQIRIADKWYLQLGGRQDMPGISESSAFQDAFTSRVGLAYKSDLGVVPYVSYAESFEPQSGKGWGGERFDPTTGRQYELGVKYEPPGTNAIATMALFDLRKQNVLTDDPDATHLCDGSRCQVQTGEISSRGIELGLTTGLADGLNAVASYTYNPVEVSKSNKAGEVGRQQADTPIHLASAWLDYSFKDGPMAGLGMGAGLRFVGKTTSAAGDVSTSPYVVDEQMVRYEIADWRMSLNVTNILDRKIEYNCGRTTNAEYCFLQEPLTVTARLARKF